MSNFCLRGSDRLALSVYSGPDESVSEDELEEEELPLEELLPLLLSESWGRETSVNNTIAIYITLVSRIRGNL